MNMTHYMGSLADYQPWNLIILWQYQLFVVKLLPYRISYFIFTRNLTGKLRLINKITTIFVGIYLPVFSFIYLNFADSSIVIILTNMLISINTKKLIIFNVIWQCSIGLMENQHLCLVQKNGFWRNVPKI